MAVQTIWIFSLCLLTEAVLTESVLSEHKTYITDALAQNAFITKTWTYSGSKFFVTVTKENKTLLSAFFDGVSAKEQDNRLSLKYNNITKEVSLLLNNISRSDEGLYQISTSINRTASEGSEKMENKWNLQLNVLEPGEIKQGYAGDYMLITEVVQESIFFPRLYHNYQLIAVLRGSECDVSTNSPFYGRIRCSKDKDNNKTRIEITNVIENDTGLYKVETEGSLTQRCFLNITVAYTNSTNKLNIVTPQERSNGVNSGQPRNKTSPPTLLTAGNRANLHAQSEPFHILPITIVAVCAVLLFFGCLMWIQRRNTNSINAVQRIVLEAMETTSSAAFSTLGRCPHTPSREEIWTSHLKYRRNTVQIPAGSLQYPTPSKTSTSDHTTCHNRLQDLDDYNYRIDVADNICKICESPSRSNETLLAECHEGSGGLIDGCPLPSDVFSATEREAYLDRPISDYTGQWQATLNTKPIYAKVKKLPELSPNNNNVAVQVIIKVLAETAIATAVLEVLTTTVNAGPLCKDGYEMVDFEHFDNPSNAFQDVDVELASVSGTPNPTFVGISTSMVDLDPGTKDEEANKTFSNVMNNASAEIVKGYDEEKPLSIRKDEQGEQKTIHVITYDHDAINLK